MAALVEYLPLTNIVTATTTTVCSRSGRLGQITINGGTLNGAITIYDSLTATGTKIGTIAASQTAGQVYTYNGRFNIGLTIVTAAAADMTVSADTGAG